MNNGKILKQISNLENERLNCFDNEGEEINSNRISEIDKLLEKKEKLLLKST